MTLSIASCATESSKSSSTGTIKVGAVLPLSGEGTPDQGLASQKAIDLAIKEVNDKGGINGRNLEVFYEDSRCEPSRGVSGIRRLIETKNVDFIIGDICDQVTAPIMKIAQDSDVVLITPGSTSPEISTAGDRIFRFWFSEDDMGNAVAQHAKSEGLDDFAIVYINNAWGISQKDAVKKHVQALGGTITSEQSVEPDTTDYRTILLKAQQSNPDAFYVGTFPNGLASFVEQKRVQGVDKPLYAHGGLVGSTLAMNLGGSDLEGLFAPFASDPDPTFTKKFEKKYGVAPGVTADSSYDIIKAIAFVMEDQDTFDSATLAKQLSGLKDFKGASGSITVNKNGDTQRKLEVKIVKDRVLVSKDS